MSDTQEYLGPKLAPDRLKHISAMAHRCVSQCDPFNVYPPAGFHADVAGKCLYERWKDSSWLVMWPTTEREPLTFLEFLMFIRHIHVMDAAVRAMQAGQTKVNETFAWDEIIQDDAIRAILATVRFEHAEIMN